MKRMMLSIALAAAVVGCGRTDPNAAQAPASGTAAAPAVEHEDCHQVAVQHKKEWGTSGIAGTVLGGAAGGLLGNQFGKGQGKTAMTAAGAVGGAVGGHELAKGNDTTVTYQERCTHD